MCFIQFPQRDRRGPVRPFFEDEGAEAELLWQPQPQAPYTLLDEAQAEVKKCQRHLAVYGVVQS
jgi:hypothetical protein